MKNPYILTLALLLFFAGSLRAVTAWSQDANTPPADTPKTSEDADSKELAPPNEEALLVLQEARSRLLRYEFVQADLAQRISLGDFRFEATGKYYASHPFKTRLEYSVKLGEMEGVFLEVCDGQVLHTSRQITSASVGKKEDATPQIELTRRDIQKIINETNLHIDQPDAVRAAEIGIGGVPAILASLERVIIFDSIREEDEDGKPVIILQGRWNEEEKGKLLTGLGGLSSQVQQFLPDRVRVTFDKQTLFPQKFQYLKKLSEERSTYSPLLTVEFSNVVINELIPVQRFTYIPPPGMEERDETDTFIKGIQDAAAASASPPAEAKQE